MDVSSPIVFVTAEPGSPAPGWIAGGLTMLERRVREAQRAKAGRVLVACEGALPAGLEATIERVVPGSPPPAGAQVVRADELAGLRLDSPATLARAEWKHMQGMQKSFQGITDEWVNHHFSLRITRVLARTPITPNQVTVVSILVAIALVLSTALGGRTGVIVGGCLLQLHNILDSCDGELARLRFQYSKLGQWLDSISDCLADGGFVAACAIAAGGPWLTIGLGVVGARLYLEADTYRHVWRLGGDFGKFRWWYENEAASLDEVYDRKSWRTYVRALFRRDTYVLLWAIFAIANLLPAVIIYAFVIFVSQAFAMVIHSYKIAARRRAG